jgi:hypothetical protein
MAAICSLAVPVGILVWNLGTGSLERTLPQTLSGLAALALSPDGRLLASGTDYRAHQIKLWDLRSGEQLRTLGGQTWMVSVLLFGPGRGSVAHAIWADPSQWWRRWLNSHLGASRPSSALVGSKQIKYSTKKGSRQSMRQSCHHWGGAGRLGLRQSAEPGGVEGMSWFWKKATALGGGCVPTRWMAFAWIAVFRCCSPPIPKCDSIWIWASSIPVPTGPALFWLNPGRCWLLGDPLRDLSSLLPSLLNPLASFGDKLKVLQLRSELARRSPEQVFQEGLGGSDCSLRGVSGAVRAFPNRSASTFSTPFSAGSF